MAKQKTKNSNGQANPPKPPAGAIKPVVWLRMSIAILVVAVAVVVTLAQYLRNPATPASAHLSNAVIAGTAPVLPGSGTSATAGTSPAPPAMPVNEAVMVTVELDFGPTVPGIAEALKEIERRSQPEQGTERTFAILDAYGEPTPQGKLHISMHVSTERTGVGSLIFKRTGEVLWSSRIVPSTNTAKGSFTGKELKIFLDDGANKLLTVDGSSGPNSILEANVKELGVPLATAWPDGAERELTFIYSACGCPVKVMVKRLGDRTMRTKEMPVMFPDDPTVMIFIKQLMRW